jgi:hypothetical protein
LLTQAWADTLERPKAAAANAGTLVGYVGVGAADDALYVVAHCVSALATTVLVALAHDGTAPLLWTPRPLHLHTATWPPLVLAVLLCAAAALTRLRTRATWRPLSAAEVHLHVCTCVGWQALTVWMGAAAANAA